MYRRRTADKHQLLITKTVVQDIKENHDRIYVAHPGIRRTHDLVALNYRWPGMRKSIEDYVKKGDPCQRRKEDRVCGPTWRSGGTDSPFPGHINGHHRSVPSDHAQKPFYAYICRSIFEICGSLTHT